MSKEIKDGFDKQGRVELKQVLGSRLSGIYERERIKSKNIQGGKELTLAEVAERCLCSQRTVERMVSCIGPLPSVYNLCMFYEALDVSPDEQIDIQKEIIRFVKTYVERE